MLLTSHTKEFFKKEKNFFYSEKAKIFMYLLLKLLLSF